MNHTTPQASPRRSPSGRSRLSARFTDPRNRARCAGAVSKQMAMTIGLVLVIAGSLAYTASQFFGGGGPTPPRIVELGFKCGKCANEFTMKNDEFQQRNIDREVIKNNPGRTIDMVDCPKCNEKHAALQMLRCPSCEKFYLPAPVNIRTAPPGYIPPEPVCPHCGTNMNQWHRERNPENKPK